VTKWCLHSFPRNYLCFKVGEEKHCLLGGIFSPVSVVISMRGKILQLTNLLFFSAFRSCPSGAVAEGDNVFKAEVSELPSNLGIAGVLTHITILSMANRSFAEGLLCIRSLIFCSGLVQLLDFKLLTSEALLVMFLSIFRIVRADFGNDLHFFSVLIQL